VSFSLFPILGVDIGPSAVKICELQSGRLRALGMALFPPEAFIDGVLSDESLVEDTLLGLLDRMKVDVRGRRVALALSGPQVEIVRVLIDQEADIDAIINYEAEQHFRQSMQDVSFQYEVMDTWSEDPRRRPVLMVAAATELIDQQIGIIRSCGLRVAITDCLPLVQAQVVDQCVGSQNQLVAVCDLGAISSTVTLLSGGQFLSYKDIAIGGQDYNRQIMGVLGVDEQMAESLKLSYSLGDPGVPQEVQQAVNEMNSALCNEIQEAIRHYMESSQPIPGISGLSCAYMVGGGAAMMGLQHALSLQLGVPAKIFNPFQSVKVDPKKFAIDYLINYGHLYSCAFGLASKTVQEKVKQSA
jgi:type IV pilus assembly protein PilM